MGDSCRARQGGLEGAWASALKSAKIVAQLKKLVQFHCRTVVNESVC